MFPRWLTKLVLAMALAVMPFQGFAETLAAMLCHSEMDAHAAQVEAHHDGSGEAAHDHEHGTPTSAGGAADNHSGDNCCHLAFSGMTATGVFVAAPQFPVLYSTQDPRRSSTFLELPQRPPLV